MKNKNTTKKCESCGGNLEFSPIDQALKCVNCESTYPIKKDKSFSYHLILEAEKINKKDIIFAENNKVFNCENCGSLIVLNNLEYSKECPYCGSSHVIETKKCPGTTPDAIIPFMFDEKQASQKFAKGMKKKWLVPNAFKKKPPVSDIYGIYIPTFSFSAVSESSYYGKSKHIHVSRDCRGRIRRSYYLKNFSGSLTKNHVNVLVESSSHMSQQELEDIRPFNYVQAVTYDDDYIRGYSVEYHESAVSNCYESGKLIIKNEVEKEIKKKEKGLVVDLTVNSKLSNEKFIYYLLPSYKFEYNYKGKKYATFLNGQTGKVGGGVPKSKIKIAFVGIAISLFICGLVALFIYSYLNGYIVFD